MVLVSQNVIFKAKRKSFAKLHKVALMSLELGTKTILDKMPDYSYQKLKLTEKVSIASKVLTEISVGSSYNARICVASTVLSIVVETSEQIIDKRAGLGVFGAPTLHAGPARLQELGRETLISVMNIEKYLSEYR